MASIRPRITLDIETFPNYFLVKLRLVDAPSIMYEFELYDGRQFGFGVIQLDRVALCNLLAVFTIVTFNGNAYDIHMLTAALLGYDNAQLKWLSDRIITVQGPSWTIARDFNLRPPHYIDHIDLFDVMPGLHSLKFYMGKMHSRTIRDLPYPPDTLITPEMLPVTREYCGNDLEGNLDALQQFKKEIRLRERLSAEYGIDLRSKSDAQIAEAVIKSELARMGVEVGKPTWAVGTYFQYDPPSFIQYHTPLLNGVLNTVRNARFYLGENGVEMPPELEALKINIGGSTYKIGIGGLHSSESGVYHVSDANYVIRDIDVESYYPTLILNSGEYPEATGPGFIPVYGGIKNKRVDAKGQLKKLKDSIPQNEKPVSTVLIVLEDLAAETDSLKITINGTFGKTLSKYGCLSAPKMGIQTTVTGQLSLFMLIEAFELNGISVVSANTDGIVTKCPRHLVTVRDSLVGEWEKRTGLKTEANDYDFIGSASVNDYIAIKTKGREVKLKGQYAPPVPVGGSWPSPTGQICVDAVVEWLLHNTPIEQTIRACTDIRKFVYVQNVRGGGQWLNRPEIEKYNTKGRMRAQLDEANFIEIDKDVFYNPFANVPPTPLKDAYKIALKMLRERDGEIYREYLGKVVRFYYAKGSTGLITYVTSGNKVPNSEGCRPMMTLTDTVPGDIDYDKYVAITKTLIQNMGIPFI